MDTHPTFGHADVLAHIAGDIADAVAGRDGETQQQRHARHGAAVRTIMSFQPRDAIEAMLAGHCVMFHELIIDCVNGTFLGRDPATRRANRNLIVAMDKAFGNNLAHLERYRSRQAEDAPNEVVVRAETEIADRLLRHGAAAQPRQQVDRGPKIPARADEPIHLHPPRDSIAGSPEVPGAATLTPVPGGSPPLRSWLASTASNLGGVAGGIRGPVPTVDHLSREHPPADRTATGGNRQSRRHPNP